MDYEELYAQLQILEKDFKDKLQTAQKSFKSLCKNSDKGELKSITKDLAAMGNFVKEFGNIVSEYSNLTDNFDAKDYMESGDFARQMTACCEKMSIDIHGSYPIYEMFPHKVKIDSDNQELYIDKKRIPCARPQYFVGLIKQSQDKLNKAAFNASAFLNELSEAYDTALAYKEKSGKTGKDGQDMLLKDLYNFLVPMQRFRREYDMQSYAFDLSRLCNLEDELLTKDGRSYEFGTSRNTKKLIRILDKEGHERYLGTIRFFTK